MTGSLDCTWYVTVKPGQRVHLVLMEREYRCNVASLLLELHYTDWYNSGPKQLCDSWSSNLPNPNEFDSAANKVTVRAKQFARGQEKGFWMTYQGE
jgi:hypothetical protein